MYLSNFFFLHMLLFIWFTLSSYYWAPPHLHYFRILMMLSVLFVFVLLLPSFFPHTKSRQEEAKMLHIWVMQYKSTKMVAILWWSYFLRSIKVHVVQLSIGVHLNWRLVFFQSDFLLVNIFWIAVYHLIVFGSVTMASMSIACSNNFNNN